MALSTFASWAGSSVVENLVSMAYSYLSDRILPTDIEAELKRLQVALPQIRTVMGIAEALKMKDPNTSEWVDQFRQAVEASEDVLDELEYKKLEAMVKNRDETGRSASSSKKRKAYTINDDTLERLKEAVTMLDRAAYSVEPLLQVATALGIDGISDSRQEASKGSWRETCSLLIERKVFGREVEKDKIIGWLKRPTLACLSSLGIVGVGGVGKTILVQFAYQEIHALNHFDKEIWVWVSINFSIEDILRNILYELGERSCSGKSLKTLQETLKEKIHSKKILLVLDDVWDDEKRSDWEKLFAPLRFVQEGSKILFTTRMQSVADLLASVISTEHESLALGGLGDQELRVLFHSYAFRDLNPDNHKDLHTVADQILKMLRGNALAAKVIGSLLNSYMDHYFWRNFLNTDSIFEAENYVVEVLKLSYYHLPADLQVCFKFCSIFPQGHKFDKEELIKMWMAVGIIRQELCQDKQPEDIGEEYFNLLLRKSFFEYSKSLEGETYVMNDLMHELAQNVSHGECCRIEPNDKSITIPSTVRHVSVHESAIEKVSHLANLRSLVITTSVEETDTDPDIFVFPKSLIKKSLRLLKICGSKNCVLPKEIIFLVHLRYLSIELDYETDQSFNYLLSTSICKLYHLQVLEFSTVGNNSSYSGIEITEITNLVSLRYMRLPKEIMQTINGIHRLTSLQELTFFVGQESGHCINELGTLNNLRHLSIMRIENIGDLVEAKSANLLGKNNLMSLSLKWTSESNFDNSEQIIDYLQPHPNLMKLTIENYKGQRSPSWMEDSPLLNLSSINLFNCPIWNNQLFSWKMPYLKILHICDCPNLDKLPNMPLSLIEFRIDKVGLTSLPDLYQSSGNNTSTPSSLKSSLRVVQIKSCPNLISLNGFFQQGNLDLQAIVELTINDCKKLVRVPVGAFGKLLSLKHLRIKDCQNLTNCPSLPLSLIELSIKNVGVSALPEYHQNSDLRGSPSTSSLISSLQEVKIKKCPKLKAFNGFLHQDNIDFQSMEELTIMDCPKLGAIGNRSNLLPTKLKMLTIANCGFLDVPLLESASNLATLTSLSINNCANISRIPSSENTFRSLCNLSITECDKLVEYSCRKQAHGADKGSSLASLKLSHLEIDHLSLLLIEPLRSLRSVTYLRVWYCSGMEALPEQWFLQNSSTLSWLSIRNASTLKSLPGIMARFTALEWLEILKADLLEELPELPASLKEKYIEGHGVTSQFGMLSRSYSSENAFGSLDSVIIDGCNKLVKHSFSKQEHGVLTNADCARSYVFENLVSTAYSYLHDQMLLADSEVELKRLRKSLPQITTVVGIVEALKMKHPSANLWVEQFRQAVEASEDVLDELEYKRLEDMVENRDETDRSASSSKKRKTCTVNDDTLEMLKEALTMLDRVAAETEHLLQVATGLGIDGFSVSRQEASSEVLRHETNSILAEIEVFGRVVEKDKIIGWLKRPTLACLSSLGIVGVGGVGKTTLVQFAYQEMCRSNHFDKIIWVCASINFSIEDITRKMLSELGESSFSGKPLKTLQETLKEKICLKKILFILDDVWDDEKRSDWEQLVASLRFVQEGSKILFTTRKQSVVDLLASVISTEHESVALGDLGEQELRVLFYNYAFPGFNPDNHKDLQTVGDQILKMLRGSTLAAKVIGSLLNSYMDHNYWRRFLNYGSIFKLEQAKDVVEVLKLSYYHLPADLQACFKFCSIFPQGHKFDKNELIKMWMAVGIIRQELCQGNQSEDIGEEYFNLLLRNSFFEYSKSWEGERYVMNDLMHELAQKVSHGECCRIEPNDKSITIPSTVRHVYVHQSEIQKVSHLANLRSLVIATSVEETGTDPDIFVLPKNLIKKSLRLLKVCGCKYCELPEEISCLVHLRYLAIKVDYETQSFKYLFPASIYNLYHLQVLEFSDDGDYSGSETTRMTNLVSLRYMRLPKEIMQTINGIHRLTSLQELTFFVGQESGHCINELGTLNNLRHLSIMRIENIGDLVEAKSANLLGKSNLMSLYLKWTSESNFDNPEQIIDCLQPHPDLMELTVENYKGQRSPSWMEQSHPLNLSSLKLFNCPIWNNQLFSWKMPYLKILHICDCPNLDKLPNMPLSLIEFRVHNVGLTSLPDLYQSAGNSTPQPLSLKSSLRVVEIKNCPNLISLNGFLQQDNLDLQAIEKFIISGCDELVLVPVGTFGKLLSLKHLSIKDCQNLTRCPNLPLSLTEFYLHNVGVSALPEYYQSSDSRGGPSTTSLKSSLRVVEIESCPHLISLNGFLQQDNLDLQAIEKFIIRGCEKLVLIAVGAFGKLLSLKHLSIEDCQNLTRCPNLPLSLTEFYLHNVGVSALPEYYQSSESRGGPSRSSLKSSLRVVEIRNCPKLTALNELFSLQMPYLKILHIYNCVSLDKLPDMPLSLIEFRIRDVGLTSLPDLYQTSGNNTPSPLSLKSLLRVVKIERCPNLKSLDGFLQQGNRDLQAIVELTIYACERLVHLPTHGFENLTSLIYLTIYGCPKLVAVDNHSNLLPTKLKKLSIENCGKLDVPLLESASSLATLTDLSINNCANITCIPSSKYAFGSLKELCICGCKKLVEHSSREQAYGANQGSSLASLKLSRLEIDHLSLLLIEPLRSLRSVSYLRVWYCSWMEALPEQWFLQNSSTLHWLSIRNASTLKSLPATLARLTALEWLEIWKADLLQELPELPATLRSLVVRDASCLKSLPARMARLTALEWLEIWKADLLEELPELPTSLKEKYIEGHGITSQFGMFSRRYLSFA